MQVMKNSSPCSNPNVYSSRGATVSFLEVRRTESAVQQITGHYIFLRLVTFVEKNISTTCYHHFILN